MATSALLLWLGLMSAAVAADGLDLSDRWVYCSFNLWVDENLVTLEDVMRRGAAAGYTGVLLTDTKFGRLGEMDSRYFRNVERVRSLAAELDLEIVPALFPVGYSESLLYHDPNLAEALPVRDAPFTVESGVARLVPDRRALNSPDWKDEVFVREGNSWRAEDPAGANARIVYQHKVRPFAQYHVWARLKTREFRGEPRIQILADGHPLAYSNLGVQPTQDWQLHHTVFNSLEHDQVTVYFGSWGADTGSLWIADMGMEEVGLLNVVRRPGAPLAVSTAGGEPLTEGEDFEPISDPRMGTVPWPGAYEVWHEPPAIGTALPDGTRLKVSYHHAITVYDGQVTLCPSEPKVLELLRDQARRIHAAWQPSAWFMSHDEIRVLNWDASCQNRELDAGELLADHIRSCIAILRETDPEARIYVWSDMFDPHHNARDGYYLVRGDLAGSWEGLDRGVIVAAWYRARRAESLRWFAQRGHPLLIAGYYDSDPELLREWLDAALGVEGVRGVMYTTWQRRYGDLERCGAIVDEYRRR